MLFFRVNIRLKLSRGRENPFKGEREEKSVDVLISFCYCLISKCMSMLLPGGK